MASSRGFSIVRTVKNPNRKTQEDKLGFVPGRMTVEFGIKVQEFVMEVAKWQIS